MIERYCFVRLTGESSTDDRRRDLSSALQRTLGGVPGVAGVTVGLPADDSAARWDVSIVTRFASLADYDLAAATAVWQRAFAELAAQAVVVKAWNFACESP